MLVVVVYDISSETGNSGKRSNIIRNMCLDYGVQVQRSVFECRFNAEEYRNFKKAAESVINCDKDSVIFYRLGNHYETKIENIGKNNKMTEKFVV